MGTTRYSASREGLLDLRRSVESLWDDVLAAYANDWNHLWVAPLVDRVATEPRRSSSNGLDVTGMEWGPDSRQMAWSAKPGTTLRSNGEGAIFVQHEVGDEARKVTLMPGGESVAAWTADAGLMVYGTGQLLGTYNRRVWSVPVGGGEPVSLTDGLGEDASLVHASARELIVEVARRAKRGVFRIPHGAR